MWDRKHAKKLSHNASMACLTFFMIWQRSETCYQVCHVRAMTLNSLRMLQMPINTPAQFNNEFVCTYFQLMTGTLFTHRIWVTQTIAKKIKLMKTAIWTLLRSVRTEHIWLRILGMKLVLRTEHRSFYLLFHKF